MPRLTVYQLCYMFCYITFLFYALCSSNCACYQANSQAGRFSNPWSFLPNVWWESTFCTVLFGSQFQVGLCYSSGQQLGWFSFNQPLLNPRCTLIGEYSARVQMCVVSAKETKEIFIDMNISTCVQVCLILKPLVSFTHLMQKSMKHYNPISSILSMILHSSSSTFMNIY